MCPALLGFLFDNFNFHLIYFYALTFARWCFNEVRVRVGKASAIFKAIQNMKSKKISLSAKTRIYEALVLSILLYSAELWPNEET